VAIPTRSKVRFRERAELLDFLLEASRLTSETLDLDRLLENVAKIVREVVPYDLLAILLYSERTQGLSIRYSIGHREEVVRTLVVPLHEGIVGEAAATRSAVLVEDVRNDPRYLNAMDAVRSELAVPMVARGKLVGVLDVQSTRLKAYAGQDRALLSLIGSRVAASIDNARLYRRVDRQNRTLRTLAHLSQEFSSILDLDELLTKIAATVRALINYDAFSIFLVDAEHRVLRHRFAVRYDQRVNIDNIPLGKGLTGAAAETREAVRVLDTATDPRYIASHPDIRSEMAVPLIVQDRVVGVLDVESDRVSYFTEEHQRTLSLLAPQIASSVENARLYEELTTREQRMEQDLKAARKVQRVLLPRTAPELRGLEIALRSRPAREITGDVYDFFEYDDGDAVIVFGDVSGKGAAAALYGAMMSGLLRMLAPRRRSPAQLLKSLNEILLERKIDAQYATMLVALWQPAGRKLVFANAGAEPPMVWRGGEILKPKVEGVPIGLLDDREYEEVTFVAEPGDMMLFYSDGVEDQLNAAEENYSCSRLTRLLEHQAASARAMGAPQSLVDAIFHDLDAFRAGTAITDDQTTVVIKVGGSTQA
jgi:sigma-B regulation protein RsbU (phosphoserine phosphatase)